MPLLTFHSLPLNYFSVLYCTPFQPYLNDANKLNFTRSFNITVVCTFDHLLDEQSNLLPYHHLLFTNVSPRAIFGAVRKDTKTIYRNLGFTGQCALKHSLLGKLRSSFSNLLYLTSSNEANRRCPKIDPELALDSQPSICHAERSQATHLIQCADLVIRNKNLNFF